MLEKLSLITGFVGLLTFLFGGFDGILITLIAILILDEITGVLASIYTKTLSSTKTFKSVISMIITMIVVVVAHLVDGIMGLGGVLRTLVITALIASESISILENAVVCGIPVPKKLIDVLEVLKGKSGDGLEELINKEKDDNEQK